MLAAVALSCVVACGDKQETIPVSAVQHIREDADKKIRDAEQQRREADRLREAAERARTEAENERRLAEGNRYFWQATTFASMVLAFVLFLFGIWIGSSARKDANAQQSRTE